MAFIERMCLCVRAEIELDSDTHESVLDPLRLC